MGELRRGQVYVDDVGGRYLIISADVWNQRRVNEVTVLALVDADDPSADAGAFTAVVTTAQTGQRWLVYADDLFAVSRDELTELAFTVDEQAMSHIDQVLRSELSASGAPVDASRPAKMPRTGQMRFAELMIDGEPESKPVVVVSCEKFHQEVGYELVIVCRASSNGVRIYDLDVELPDGKVVCSDVRTVARESITERSPKFAAVNGAHQVEIRRKLHLFLGLGEPD